MDEGEQVQVSAGERGWMKVVENIRDGRGGAFSSGAGRRQKSAGRGKRAKIIMEILIQWKQLSLTLVFMVMNQLCR